MTDEELLADLLLRWEELHEKGQETSAEELCRDCPHLAPLLAERIHALKVTAWMERPDDDGGTQPDPPTPSAPRTLAGRYRLDEKIAEGGFAEVWKGYDLELRRAVAVKVPKPGRLLSTERFMAEARRVAGLKHPGVVPVFDVGRDGDSCFIVSEFVEGGSLADRIAKNRPTQPGSRPPGRRDRRDAGLRPSAGLHPPGHQAGQHPDRPPRQGAAGRLRHRPLA